MAFLREAFLGRRENMLPTGVVCQEVANSNLSAAELGLRDEQGAPTHLLKIEGDCGMQGSPPTQESWGTPWEDHAVQ